MKTSSNLIQPQLLTKLENAGTMDEDILTTEENYICPAYGKTCKRCHKPNHFAAKCRTKGKGTGRDVRAVEDENMDEVFPTKFSVLQVAR